MNTPPNPIRRAWPACLMLALAAPAAWAAPDHYYDGTRKVPITRQADLVAEIAVPGQRSALRAEGGGAAPLVAGDSLVRIRRVAAGAVNPSVAAGGAGTTSPVYRQGAGSTGRLMTLPGGVLVKFPAGWSRERVDAWLAARGHAAARPMAWGPQWYLVETPAGLASLEAANAMVESGEVLSASPNWWKQTSTR